MSLASGGRSPIRGHVSVTAESPSCWSSSEEGTAGHEAGNGLPIIPQQAGDYCWTVLPEAWCRPRKGVVESAGLDRDPGDGHQPDSRLIEREDHPTGSQMLVGQEITDVGD